jgi:hypothetical protein
MDVNKIKSELIANILAACVISFIFFIISDFLFSPPNLNGKWEMVLKINDSDYSDYKGIMLKYDIYLLQNGDDIVGTAEKLGEFNNDEYIKYTIPIRSEIKGSITRKYFKNDILNIHFIEHGERRLTSSYFKLTRFNDSYMMGNFSSSAARSIGASKWLRSIENVKLNFN